MIDLCLIGIGTGNPDHVTMEARKAIAEADLIIIPRKGDEKSDLADLRHQICDDILGPNAPNIAEFDLPVRDPSIPYLERVDRWHDTIAEVWHKTILAHRPLGGRVALLIWGDPSLYDSSLRIASRLEPAPKIRVIAGITSLQALTAAHAIPINEIGKPYMVTTGRQLRENGWPHGVDTIAVMLDGDCAFQHLAPEGIEIFWGAYLGMPNQIIASGPLSEMSQRIIETRAKAREEHGWLMDIYILKRF